MPVAKFPAFCQQKCKFVCFGVKILNFVYFGVKKSGISVFLVPAGGSMQCIMHIHDCSARRSLTLYSIVAETSEIQCSRIQLYVVNCKCSAMHYSSMQM